MAKKTGQNTTARKEKTIQEKQSQLLQSTIMEGIGLSVVGAYVAASCGAYASTHPRADLGECFSGAFSEVMKNPLYFYPITSEAVSAIIVTVMMIVLIVFMQYTINKLRVHHDINTLKGSAKWGDVREFTRRMGDFIEVQK